ncbi:hypothetical protein EDB19DRAFT_1832528 [Suillus lakei]|nr:hypothetical protein EDB19DRAFT_1832528 [Suillus lakei]
MFDACIGGKVGTTSFMEGTNGIFVITVDENISIRYAKRGGDSDDKLNRDSLQPTDVMPNRIIPSILSDPCLPESIPAKTNACACGCINPDVIVSCGRSGREKMRRMVMLKEIEPPSEVGPD